MNAASCLIRNSGRPRKGRPLYIRLLSARDFLTAPRSISCWIGTETTLGDPHAVGSRISPNGVARICVITVLMTAATRPSQSNTGATSHSFVVGMSALGQKQTFAVQNGMSALHPKADMCGATRHVR